MARSSLCFWHSDPTQRRPYGFSMEGPIDLLWYEVIYLDSLKKKKSSGPARCVGTHL